MTNEEESRSPSPGLRSVTLHRNRVLEGVRREEAGSGGGGGVGRGETGRLGVVTLTPPCPPPAPSFLTPLLGRGRWQRGRQSQPAPRLQALPTLREGLTGSLDEAGTPGYVSHWADELLNKDCFCCRKRECQKCHRTCPRFGVTDKEEMALRVTGGGGE